MWEIVINGGWQRFPTRGAKTFVVLKLRVTMYYSIILYIFLLVGQSFQNRFGSSTSLMGLKMAMHASGEKRHETIRESRVRPSWDIYNHAKIYRKKVKMGTKGTVTRGEYHILHDDIIAA